MSAGNNGSLGQASFDYATILTPGTPFSAVALYQGSLLCKTAPSDNVEEPPPKGVILVRRLCYVSTDSSTVVQTLWLRCLCLDPSASLLPTLHEGRSKRLHRQIYQLPKFIILRVVIHEKCLGDQTLDVMQRLPTSLAITAAQSITTIASTSFNITLTIAVPSGQAVEGQNVSVSFGDGSPAVTVLTSTYGYVSVVHAFAAAGKYNVTATYAGEDLLVLRLSHVLS